MKLLDRSIILLKDPLFPLFNSFSFNLFKFVAGSGLLVYPVTICRVNLSEFLCK